MNVEHLPRRKTKKSISLLLFILIMQCMLINYPVAAANNSIKEIHNEKIARGISFQEKHYTDYQENTAKNESEFIITADLNDPTVNIITGKANGKVLQLETVSDQITREQLKGQNVVAGINGDMFNISSGTTDYRSPQGIQVKDGKILVGFDTIWAEPRFPIFAITKNRKPMISYVSMDAKLTVVDTPYEAKHGIANPDTNFTTSIDTINRNNTAIMSDRMILETPQLADTPTVAFTDEQALNGTLTVLKNISGFENGFIQLGTEYEAEIASVGDTSTGSTSIQIPPDAMVLASQGLKATWVKEHIQKGDKIRFSFNLKDQEGNILDLDQAISAWLPLVENGHALTETEMLEKCKNDWNGGSATIKAPDKARTAIGYTADDKVIALVFDGGGASKDSYGIDLPGIAARMEELGVIAAVSLDGGGSTQMNTRLFGEENVKLINNPSDDKERRVSNTILFTSSAPKTPAIKKLKVNKDINIYKNSSYAFQLRGQDRNANPVDLSKTKVKWKIEPNRNAWPKGVHSSIDKQGLFTAGKLARNEKVYASIGKVKSFATVTVFDSLYSLGLTDSGIIAVETNAQKQFQITAHTKDGQAIVISNSAAQWSVTPSAIAAINSNGLLITKGKGTGTVTAKVDNKEVSIDFVVGQKDQLIDSYESTDSAYYSADGYIGGSCQISADQVKNGNSSLRVDYDYASWAKVYNGTINVVTDTEKRAPTYTSTLRPKKLAMWVYGDGQAPWLRAKIRDGNGNARTLNLASNINWIGWKYVDAVIPSDIPMPISLDYFYMVETNKSKNFKGTIYFDDIRFIYSNKL